MKCRHCRRNKAQPKKKFLCWTCAQVPSIRDLYPSLSKYARRSPIKDSLRQSKPCSPTQHPPASKAKVDVMAERAALGLSLFSKADADMGAWEGHKETVPGMLTLSGSGVRLERRKR